MSDETNDPKTEASPSSKADIHDLIADKFAAVNDAIAAISARLDTVVSRVSTESGISADELAQLRASVAQSGAMTQDEVNRVRVMISKWFPHDTTA